MNNDFEDLTNGDDDPDDSDLEFDVGPLAREVDERSLTPDAVDHFSRHLTLNGQTVELDESQSAAVRMAAKHRLSVITGQAGSGKSFCIAAIADLFADAGIPVGLAAPTGKASRRMTEATGREAATIHRTLGSRGDQFTHNDSNPLPAGLWVVDEISMCDSDLLYRFLLAVPPNSAVVLVGDHEQLPPVGAGAPLRDILKQNLAPISRLEKCHRQAGTLRRNCHSLLAGLVERNQMQPDVAGGPPPWVVHRGLATNEDVITAVKSLYGSHLRKWGFDPIKDVQFMSPVHKGPVGTKRINRLMQWLHQGSLGNQLAEPREEEELPPDYWVGDKVIQTKNDYDLDLMNGQVGYIVDVWAKEMQIKFDDRMVYVPKDKWGNLDLAYCTSVHKFQGSEVPCAVTICSRSHRWMWSRNLIYTAMTRARKTAVIIGDGETADLAASRIEENKRTTLLGCLGKDSHHEL